jgi:hypothetical protein
MRYDFESAAFLDASGFSEDLIRTFSYPPPIPGSVIDTNSVLLTPEIHRGPPELRDVNVTWNSVSFTIFAPAARGGLFGRHSGSMTVHVSFAYFDSANTMSPEDLRDDWNRAQAAFAERFLKDSHSSEQRSSSPSPAVGS